MIARLIPSTVKPFVKRLLRRPPSQISLLDYVDRKSLFDRHQLERLGTDYGGWIIPIEAALTNSSVCYSAGAGEDISFDCLLAERYGCQVQIIDPTPRALQHFKDLEQAVYSGRRFPIDKSPTEFYRVSPEVFGRLRFLPFGLADRDCDVKLYLPRNPEHVSCSALNLQKTRDYVTAKCLRLSSLMRQSGNTGIDLLKMDIEGLEYRVIQDLIATKILPRILLIEFDEIHTPKNVGAARRIRRHITMLLGVGYRCVAIDGSNASFVRAGLWLLFSMTP